MLSLCCFCQLSAVSLIILTRSELDYKAANLIQRIKMGKCASQSQERPIRESWKWWNWRTEISSPTHQENPFFMIALEFWVLVVSLACMFLFSLCISQMASLPQASFNSKLPQSQSMPESHLNSTCLGICALGAKVVIRVQLYIHLISQENLLMPWTQACTTTGCGKLMISKVFSNLMLL